MIYKKVNEMNRPLKKGETYLVPCVRVVKRRMKSEDELFRDEDCFLSAEDEIIVPVIDHPHSDVENGQIEAHYHADTRFLDIAVTEINLTRPLADHKLFYLPMKVITERFDMGTAVTEIKNSKFKHKCIHKGKCPHRGYDLSP